jgi:hypothetical protein
MFPPINRPMERPKTRKSELKTFIIYLMYEANKKGFGFIDSYSFIDCLIER